MTNLSRRGKLLKKGEVEGRRKKKERKKKLGDVYKSEVRVRGTSDRMELWGFPVSPRPPRIAS
jgi:uncharacterized protein Veg